MSENGKKKPEKKPEKRLLLPDPDILAFAVATFVAGGVAAAGMFWLGLTAFETVFRAGLTFVVTYAAVFALVKFVVRTLLTEIATKQQEEFELQRQAMEAQKGQEPALPEQRSGEAGK